ncbi:MAG: hypothetical protein ACOZB0_00160, partial [Pseudomonadota bacterium]
MLVGKQVSLDGTALLHGGRVKDEDQVATILPGQARVRFFEAPLFGFFTARRRCVIAVKTPR